MLKTLSAFTAFFRHKVKRTTMSMLTMEDVVYDMEQYVNRTEESLYKTIDQKQIKQSRKVLLETFQPNPLLWSKVYASTVAIAQDRYKRSGLRSTFHGLRLLIQRQTLYAIENASYQTSDGTKVVIDPNDVIRSAKGTKYYTTKDIESISAQQNQNSNNNDDNESKQSKCEIDVLNTDCLDAAYSLLCDGYNPCLLNMANANTPGGGFSSGMGAQEENLCRRTTLITALVNYVKTNKDRLDPNRAWGYPIESFGSIYVPNVTVIRSNEAPLGYEFLAKPFKIAIVTAAMLNRPQYNNAFEYTNATKPVVEKKLKSVLRTAYDNGHDSIVLSAWGCGAFRNPPVGQSKLWKNILLNDEEFEGKFKKIIFAIFDDHNAGKQHNPFGNYLPFIDAFGIAEKRVFEFAKQLNAKNKDDDEEDAEMKDNKDMKDAFAVLCQIFMNIEESKSRDLDYDAINTKLGENALAMNILYCAGFKRSSDGSRLQLEARRIPIAQEVYAQLQTI
eukprot:574224_1